MNTLNLKVRVNEINAFIQQNLWLDFEVIEYKKSRLTIFGSIDVSVQHDIEIHFDDIFFVSLPMEWKTDTSNIVLTMLEGESAVSLNKKFQVEQDYHIFKFIPEDYLEDFGCYIAAKNISYKIINK
jgi:hypothetical protein